MAPRSAPLVAGLALLPLLGVVPAAAAGAGDCAAPAEVWGAFPALAAAGRSIGGEHELTIVALGSSSTFGTGASAPAFAYPAQLADLLRSRLPGIAVTVVNRGVAGETVAANLARFATDVAAARPDLVIWQVGTNDAMQGIPVETVRRGILDGISRLRRLGSDVVLMEPQFFPAHAPTPAMTAMMAMVRAVGAEQGVAVLPRYALMRYWLDSGQLPAAALVGADGLHMTDTSYRCLATRVADLIPPPAPAAAGSGSNLVTRGAGLPVAGVVPAALR